MAKEDHKKKIVKMLSKYETTMFVSHNKQGKGLVSRPMTTQKSEFDGTVWFFVSSDADVIEEIEANPEVNVAYTRDETFVSLSGNASMVNDDAKKKELWYPELKQWFNGEGPESSHVRLIKVKVETAHYWDSSNAEARAKKGEEPIEYGSVTY